MSILNKEMYEAFIEAGVAKESASRAAESVEHSDLDKRLAIVETKRGTISVSIKGLFYSRGRINEINGVRVK